jgi:hypothetical protein
MRFAVYRVTITSGEALGEVSSLGGAMAFKITGGERGHMPVLANADLILLSDMLLSQAGLKAFQNILFVIDVKPPLFSIILSILVV